MYDPYSYAEPDARGSVSLGMLNPITSMASPGLTFVYDRDR